MAAPDVHADVERGRAVILDGLRLALADHLVREQDRRVVDEAAHVLLCPDVVIIDAVAEFRETRLRKLRVFPEKAEGDRVLDRHEVLGVGLVMLPQVSKFVAAAFRSRDNPKALLSGKRIGDRGIDRRPDVEGLLMDGELVKDEIGRITARRVWIGRDRHDASTVREANLSAREQGVGGITQFVIAVHRRLDRLRPLLGLLHPFQRLAFAGGEDHPEVGRMLGLGHGIRHRLARGREGLAGLTRPHPDLEARPVLHPGALPGQENFVQDRDGFCHWRVN